MNNTLEDLDLYYKGICSCSQDKCIRHGKEREELKCQGCENLTHYRKLIDRIDNTEKGY